MKSRFGDRFLPRRMTKGSAGYDYFLPKGFSLRYGESMMIETGISMEPGDIPEGYFGLIAPRSSYGMKYGLMLNNTVAIIDSDYTQEILVKVKCTDPSVEMVRFKEGDRFCQMVLIPYGIIPTEIPPEEERSGGLGSTGA